MDDSAYSDATSGIIVFLILLVIGGGWYLFHMYPDIRGPASDMEINVKIDPHGNISQYSVVLQFVDSSSYSKFITELSSKKIPSLTDYEFHSITSTDTFKLINDSTNNKLTIESRDPFDPNQVCSEIKINKYTDYWEYIDTSVVNSSYIPEKYINKLTYSLTIPSALIEANSLENSTPLLSTEKVITWRMDRNKNPLNPAGEKIDTQTIYVKFAVPDPNQFPIIPVVVGGIVLLIIIGLLIIRR